MRKASAFDLDHLEARILRVDLALSYENLIYSCHSCNLSKGSRQIEIPSATMLEVAPDGTISAPTDAGQRVIDMLSLDDAGSTRYRRMIIGIVRSTHNVSSEAETFTLMMGFPVDNLPDLTRLNCPKNSRPEGVTDSWHARHQRGELPGYYE